MSDESEPVEVLCDFPGWSTSIGMSWASGNAMMHLDISGDDCELAIEGDFRPTVEQAREIGQALIEWASSRRSG